MGLEKFKEDYNPEKILFRDEQIKRIEDVFKNYKEYGMASNLLLSGVTGSGKTSTVTYLINKNDNCIYVSAFNLKKTFEVWKKLLGSKKRPDFLLNQVIEN